MSAIAFSEHGAVYQWEKKKQLVEKAGMKYIHAIEMYITSDLENKIRDNYHCILIAKNYEGVREINKLSSISFNKQDGHFYYQPRITFKELTETSDNIIITTACLGGILWKGKELNPDLRQQFIDFLMKNKDRCFLEIQHHNVDEQKRYNSELYHLHKQTGIRLIVGTDTHTLNDEYAEGRKLLQKRKGVFFENEDGWDLNFKSYDELVLAFKTQNNLPEDIFLEAIENTNIMADMIEEFQIDRSYKYPSFGSDSVKLLQEKILQGVKNKKIHQKPNFEEYKQRINSEVKAFIHNNAVDYMLLEEDYKSALRKKGVYCGYGRGSVTGSLVAYLLGITDIDAVKHKTSFERFMHNERVSIGDIDSDWFKTDRDIVKDYLFNKQGLYCSDIITFNTIQLKGAIRDVGGALDIPLHIIDGITKNIETNEQKYRQEYPELFKWCDLLNGVVVSVGSHAGGFLVSPIPTDEYIGLCYNKESAYPVSQLDMKEVEAQGYVKLDILGVDSIGLINQTCKLAGIDRLTPDNTPDDINVWKSIRDDTTAIFQWEGSDYSSQYLKELFSDNTIAKIKANNPNFSYMDLLSIGNGAIRPAGASYRNALAKGEFKDNGHPMLNDFLKPTLGFLVFQEQIINFLNQFCGYTMGEADNVRRAFAKKTGTEKELPKIKNGFIKTMKEKYNTSTEEAEKLIKDFLIVIEDASDYLFSLNHADVYSWIGYICGYLRYHYPFEFIVTALNIYANDNEKTTEIIEYAKKRGIKIKGVEFGKTLSDYQIDKQEQSIYRGLKAIKYLNKKIGKELYNLKDNHYSDFYDLLIDIGDKTTINSRQLEILIKLNFFKKFGNPNQLLFKTHIFDTYYHRKTIDKNDIITQNNKKQFQKIIEKETEKKYFLLPNSNIDFIRCIDNVQNIQEIKTTLKEYIDFEMECLGDTEIKIPELPPTYRLIKNITGKYAAKYIELYTIQNGYIETVKVRGNTLQNNPLQKGDVIKVVNISEEKKYIKTDDGFKQIDELEPILKQWVKIDK